MGSSYSWVRIPPSPLSKSPWSPSASTGLFVRGDGCAAARASCSSPRPRVRRARAASRSCVAALRISGSGSSASPRISNPTLSALKKPVVAPSPSDGCAGLRSARHPGWHRRHRLAVSLRIQLRLAFLPAGRRCESRASALHRPEPGGEHGPCRSRRWLRRSAGVMLLALTSRPARPRRVAKLRRCAPHLRIRILGIASDFESHPSCSRVVRVRSKRLPVRRSPGAARTQPGEPTTSSSDSDDLVQQTNACWHP